MFGPWEKEVSTIVNIMKEAIPFTLHGQEKLNQTEIKEKGDGTIVSIYDFATQTIIMKGIAESLPGDDVFGEEDFSKISPQFLELVKKLLPQDIDPMKICSKAICNIGEENHRTWLVDPIDGTEGFVKQTSFAIATCLLVDLKPKVSITAWPRHDKKYTGIDMEGPLIFIAWEGGKSIVMDLNGNTKEMGVITEGRPCTLRNGAGRVQTYISKQLNIPDYISLVSMVKAFILAAGKANIYARIHRCPENSWDIAPFQLFIQNCGCIITNGKGEEIEYLPNGQVKNSIYGILCTCGGPEFHEKVLKVMQEGIRTIYGIV